MSSHPLLNALANLDRAVKEMQLWKAEVERLLGLPIRVKGDAS